MTCSRCGRSTPRVSGWCASCEALANLGEGAAVTVASAWPPYSADTAIGTIPALLGRIGVPGATASVPVADATGPYTAFPLMAESTHLGVNASDPDPDETGPGLTPPEQDPDATRLVAPGSGQENSRGPAHSARGRNPNLAAGESANALVGRSLGSRYRVQRLLGAGGMGAVYEAFDVDLGVAVALKTVRPEIAADPDTARMLERTVQTGTAARASGHAQERRPHSRPREIDGIKYITMPYLEGDDLATVLKTTGKSAGRARDAPSRGRSPPGLRPRTTPASSIAISSPPTS